MQCPTSDQNLDRIVREAKINSYFPGILARYLKVVPCVSRGEQGERHKKAKVYETLGDAVYEVVARLWQERYGLTDRNYDALKSNLVQGCRFSRTGICNGLAPFYSENPGYKLMGPCADYLEALIGAVFSYLTEYRFSDPIQRIQEWLEDILEINQPSRLIRDRFHCGGSHNEWSAVNGNSLCRRDDHGLRCYDKEGEFDVSPRRLESYHYQPLPPPIPSISTRRSVRGSYRYEPYAGPHPR